MPALRDLEQSLVSLGPHIFRQLRPEIGAHVPALSLQGDYGPTWSQWRGYKYKHPLIRPVCPGFHLLSNRYCGHRTY